MVKILEQLYQIVPILTNDYIIDSYYGNEILNGKTIKEFLMVKPFHME